MGFYGLVSASSMVVAIAIIAVSISISHNAIAMSIAASRYVSLQTLNSFSTMINITMPSNNYSTSDWLNAIRACAMADNMDIYINGSVIIISNSDGIRVFRIYN